jgi:hypothetical protein
VNLNKALSEFEIKNSGDAAIALTAASDLTAMVESATGLNYEDILKSLYVTKEARKLSAEINKELGVVKISIDIATSHMLFVNTEDSRIVALDLLDNTIHKKEDFEIDEKFEKDIYDAFDIAKERVTDFINNIKNIKITVEK